LPILILIILATLAAAWLRSIVSSPLLARKVVDYR
jgi:hypothetical protein